MFDIGPLKLVALAVLAVVIFGPDKLPELIARGMRMLQAVREFSDQAKQDIRGELGPGFQDFEFEDLNPKAFVRKQLAAHGEELGFDDLRDLKHHLSQGAAAATARTRALRADPLGATEPRSASPSATAPAMPLAAARAAAFDVEAT